jgi:peptide/nickel transport system substrate-binding protein
MDNKSGWKRFQRLKFDSKKISKNARRMEAASTRHAHRFVVKKLENLRDARQHIIGWLALVTVLVVAVALQMSWYQEVYQKSVRSAGGTYAEAIIGSINTLNPLYATSTSELSSSRLIFSSLYDYDATGHLRGDVAKSIRADKNKQIYTVELRDDVYWHDGKKLTADDVVYTVGIMKDPEARSPLQRSWDDVAAKTIDDHTVQFELSGPLASFQSALTFSILPKHILGDVSPSTMRENTFGVSPIGSGPFKFRLLQSVSSGKQHKIVHLSANQDYYDGQPKVNFFEIHSYATREGVLSAAKANEVSAAVGVRKGDDKELPIGFSVKSLPVNSGVYALFNTTSPILKDISIRKALQAGTDTNLLREKTYKNAPKLDLPFIRSQITRENSSVQKPSYSPSRAKRLLDKAGWKVNPLDGIRSKKKTQLEVKIVSSKDGQYSNVVDELIRQWKELGVKVSVVEFEQSSGSQSFAESILQPRAYDVLVNELTIGGDPDVFAYWHSSQASSLGLNFSNYKNGIVDDALVSARIRSESNLRGEKYKTFARQWLNDVPAIGLYQSTVGYASSDQTYSIDDVTILPTLTDRYNNVKYWTAQNSQVYKTP